MRVTLRRFDIGKNATCGLLFINGVYVAHTMENTHKRIKPGTYQLILSHSPKFTPKYGHEMIEVVLPGTERMGERDQILFHRGNYFSDSLGCVLVGDGFMGFPLGDNTIQGSTTCYDRLYPIMSSEIKDGPAIFVVSETHEVPLVGEAPANPVSVA